MWLAYLFIALFVLAALAYTLRPFLRSPAPLPQSPRPDELRGEAEMLKAQARESEGEERKRILAQVVRLERELTEMGNLAPPAPRRLNPVVLGLSALALIALGAGLVRFTVPRLPGETIITARNEARELGKLEALAKSSNKLEDWLTYADKAWQLKDYERASGAYLEIIGRDKGNATAIGRLGILIFMSGAAQDAIRPLEVATAAQPTVPEPWLFLGNAYFQVGNMKNAISAWQQYLGAGGAAKERVQTLIQTAQAQMEQAAQAPPGQRIYLQKCAACHGAEAQGGVGPGLKGNPISKVPEALSEIVTKGRNTMAPVSLTPQELSDLLGYLKSL
jgi:mono/diheme cytochrome c family protein